MKSMERVVRFTSAGRRAVRLCIEHGVPGYSARPKDVSSLIDKCCKHWAM